jgi:hypothetical protein
MKYTLITPTGRIYQFYIEAVALTFQSAYGGTIFTEAIFNKEIQNETLY